MKASDVTILKSLIADTVLKMKAKYQDPLVYVGGDWNRRDINGAFNDFVGWSQTTVAF